MANEYTHLIIKDVREHRDTTTAEIRIYADCEEVRPRSYAINITKQSFALINQIKSSKGKRIMFPTREASFDGRSFVTVGEGEIILTETSVQPAKI
jgi:hypothetical protein